MVQLYIAPDYIQVTSGSGREGRLRDHGLEEEPRTEPIGQTQNLMHTPENTTLSHMPVGSERAQGLVDIGMFVSRWSPLLSEVYIGQPTSLQLTLPLWSSLQCPQVGTIAVVNTCAIVSVLATAADKKDAPVHAGLRRWEYEPLTLAQPTAAPRSAQFGRLVRLLRYQPATLITHQYRKTPGVVAGETLTNIMS